MLIMHTSFEAQEEIASFFPVHRRLEEIALLFFLPKKRLDFFPRLPCLFVSIFTRKDIVFCLSSFGNWIVGKSRTKNVAVIHWNIHKAWKNKEVLLVAVAVLVVVAVVCFIRLCATDSQSQITRPTQWKCERKRMAQQPQQQQPHNK